MFFGPLIFILLIIWIMFIIIRPNHGYYGHDGCHTDYHSNTQVASNRSLDILKERYAKGEITEEEYLRMKRNLE